MNVLLSLNKKGINVEAIVDIREQPNSKFITETENLGIKIYKSHSIVDTEGYKRINKITIMELSKDGQAFTSSKKIKLDCDCLAIAGGWTPAVHLFTQSGGKLKFRDEDQVFIPDMYPSDQISIGSCNGDFELDDIVENVSRNLKDFLNIKKTDYDNLNIECPKDKEIRNIWLLPSDKNLGKTKPFVDYQNDATAKDIKLALREGFRSIEHVKRYTTNRYGYRSRKAWKYACARNYCRNCWNKDWRTWYNNIQASLYTFNIWNHCWKGMLENILIRLEELQ